MRILRSVKYYRRRDLIGNEDKLNYWVYIVSYKIGEFEKCWKQHLTKLNSERTSLILYKFGVSWMPMEKGVI